MNNQPDTPLLPQLATLLPARVSKRNVIAILALTLGCALVATLLLPRPNPFPYRFALGQPWNYRSLKAPFDFDVLYPEEKVRIDLARVKAEHGPHFQINDAVAKRQKKLLSDLLTEQARIGRNDVQYEDLVRNLGMYKSYGQHMLDDVFERGVLGQEELDKIRNLPGKNWYLVSGNNIRRIVPDSLLTIKQAQNIFSDSLPFSPLRQPELLLPVLEKTIAPNTFYSDSLTQATLRHKTTEITSTGELVKKGDILVHRNELVNESVFRKLDSLSRRYSTDSSWELWGGRFLLVLLCFALFFLYLLHRGALPRALPGASLWAVGSLAVLYAGMYIGPAVALLLPLWILPRLSLKETRAHGGYALWTLVTMLTTISLDWAGGWLAIQAAGVAGMYFLLPHTNHGWKTQTVAMLSIAGLQSLFWLSVLWSEKIPPSLCTPDILLFLLAGNLIAWLCVRFLPYFR